MPFGMEAGPIGRIEEYGGGRIGDAKGTHRSLAKDAPLTRSVQRIGRIVSHALVGGLHHQYVRL
jgi:hypothetical protein